MRQAELLRHRLSDRDGLRSRYLLFDRQALYRLSYTARREIVWEDLNLSLFIGGTATAALTSPVVVSHDLTTLPMPSPFSQGGDPRAPRS